MIFLYINVIHFWIIWAHGPMGPGPWAWDTRAQAHGPGIPGPGPIEVPGGPPRLCHGGGRGRNTENDPHVLFYQREHNTSHA